MSEIKVFKPFWIWQYKKIERWLEEMELKGKRLKRIDSLGSIFYFEDCEPQKVTYGIEYANKITDKYREDVSKKGWQLFASSFGWVILRSEYATKKPDFFTDHSQAIKRNKNFMMIFVILFYVFAFQLPSEISSLSINSNMISLIVKLIILVLTLAISITLAVLLMYYLGTNITLARKKKL